jgi:hypothetical protein
VSRYRRRRAVGRHERSATPGTSRTHDGTRSANGRKWLAAVLAALVVVAASGCGKERLSRADYRERANEICASVKAVDKRLRMHDAKAAARMNEATKKAAGRLRELRPPEGSDASHRELVFAFEGFAKTFESYGTLSRDERDARLFVDSVAADRAARELKVPACRATA